VQGCVILFIQHKESGLSLLRSEFEHQFNDLKVTLRADHMYRSGIVDLLRVQAPSVSGISKKTIVYKKGKFKRVFDTSLSVNSKKIDTFDNEKSKMFFFIKKKNKQNAQLVPCSIKPLIFLIIKTPFMKRGRGCNMRQEFNIKIQSQNIFSNMKKYFLQKSFWEAQVQVKVN